MKHARVTAVAATFAAATVVGGVVAASGGAAAGVASLRFYERPGATSIVHHGSKGAKRAAGDVVLFENPVFDRQGTRVGTDAGACTMLNASQSLCDTTLVLPKGEIVTHGLQGVKTTFEVAVTGGTGLYAGARGTMTARPIKDGGATILIDLL
jgi:Dirigent-like protein